MTVMRAWAVRSPMFATKRRSSARPPGLDVPSAQYHAASAALAAGTRGPSATSADALLDLVVALRSRTAARMRQPSTTTTTMIRPRRALLVLTFSPPRPRDDGGAVASRTVRSPATAATPQ